MARCADIVRVPVTGREPGVLGVVEGCISPRDGVVAVLACRREELWLRRVAGIAGVVVIGLMAADASGGQCRVVVIDVALRTLPRRHCVRAGQRERCVVVIERRVGPDNGVVAQLARGWESRRSMGRIGRACVILLVARIAQSAVQRIVIVHVAIGALARRHGVRPR